VKKVPFAAVVGVLVVAIGLVLVARAGDDSGFLFAR
jgi:hypothetical protein